VDAGAVQPVTHWNVPPEFWHNGAVASHFFVQEPHVSGLEKSVSQPSFESVLQSAKPALHVPIAH